MSSEDVLFAVSNVTHGVPVALLLWARSGRTRRDEDRFLDQFDPNNEAGALLALQACG